MTKTKVLIVGGYGTVGCVVAEILAKDERIIPVIAGRNASKARELAQKYQTEWRMVDIADTESVPAALADINIVVNCFSGPFTHFPLHLPEIAAERGIHYLDVSGSYEYVERFLKLDGIAKKNNATVITALGTNPGIPGLIVLNAKTEFDQLETAKIYFVLGSRLDGISVSSLKELKYMFDVKPLAWSNSHWTKPKSESVKEYIGKPFEKEIYLGAALTRDLLSLPALTGINELSFWSGSQNTIQGLTMIIGLKMGLTGSERGAQLLLWLLKKLGETKDGIADALVKVEISGRKNGLRQKQTVELYCEENYATAIVPAIVCQQLVEGKITQTGAFVPPEVVPAKDFVERLKKYNIHWQAA